ncbi:maleylacetate reductase [Candidimonas nitroreducens]|uniref:maleylacetate reductase n=1 Tax=Candidimonas nitroreducens TaxID=683354 RepID=A0A225MB04_9BURK|nr:maleylacetate reductase [Candidimonas nitroreducens]OWT56159.1 maleylacetate reductase [Candidimonas nitroreducens]
MKEFVYSSLPSRVVFGRGALANLGPEIELLGATRVLVLSTPGHRSQAQAIADDLGRLAVGVFAGAVMHVPADTARAASDEACRLNADCTLAVGGGSTVGLAKAIALDCGLPIVAVPTTYAGSEMTPIYGITAAGAKKTGRDARVLPRTVIYDPDLTLGLPAGLSITSGMNAIAHAAEGLYARDGNPIMSLMAEEGIRALAHSLPAIRRRPGDIEARGDALYGAWLCGTVLGNVGMALHHKLCHVLGGTFNLPHAETHTVVLPHAIAFNAQSAPDAMRRIQRALGVDASTSAAAALFDLARDNGAPVALQELGALTEADMAKAADLVVNAPYWNPRQIDATQRADILGLLLDAYHGNRPK